MVTHRMKKVMTMSGKMNGVKVVRGMIYKEIA
jgi:hypothetical protein